MKTIPQIFINLASDQSIEIPYGLDKFEIIAASSITAARIATAAGKNTADRHDYQAAIKLYLNNLPKDEESARSIIARDAATVLGIPEIASERLALESARRAVAEARAEAEAAELLQGRRLSRILRLEESINEARRDRQAWDIDFEASTAEAELLILTHWGKTPVVAPFHSIYQIEVLKRLQPKALSAIDKRIKEAEDELSALRGATTPEPKPLARGRQNLSATLD